jgi:hypothetical protein
MAAMPVVDDAQADPQAPPSDDPQVEGERADGGRRRRGRRGGRDRNGPRDGVNGAGGEEQQSLPLSGDSGDADGAAPASRTSAQEGDAMMPAPAATRAPAATWPSPVAPAPITAAPAPDLLTSPAPAPITTPAADVGRQPIVLARTAAELEAERRAMLAAAGLALVETDATKWREAYDRAAAIVEAAPSPRVIRPRTSADDGPLVQVETRRS